MRLNVFRSRVRWLVTLSIEPVGFDRASTADGVRVDAERRMTVDGRRAGVKKW
jgi:hypothetical protein